MQRQRPASATNGVTTLFAWFRQVVAQHLPENAVRRQASGPREVLTAIGVPNERYPWLDAIDVNEHAWMSRCQPQ